MGQHTMEQHSIHKAKKYISMLPRAAGNEPYPTSPPSSTYPTSPPSQPTQPLLPHPPTPPTLPHPPTPTVPSPERLLQWFLRCVFFFSKVSLACKYSHLVSQPLLEVSNERRLGLQSRVFRLEMLIFSPFAHHQGLRFFLLL